MSPRRELLAFAAVLAGLVASFFAESLFLGKVLSPADALRVSASFRDARGPLYEPENRLLMDPVLQFQPWLEFNRAMIRQGKLPLWNDRAGCGAPHLANGQSAVFDPFHAIAYLGRLPDAIAWIAAARLWVAGLGMFLLAKAWDFGPWGRWFSGLTFPFCGFLVAWLLYPVTSVAIWMPWLFLAGDRVLGHPGPREIGGLALATGLVLLGGHVQTSAHVLLAAGLYAAWRAATRRPAPPRWKSLTAWGAGIVLGTSLAAVEVVPLGCYLARSPVWGDRQRVRRPPWVLARPRLLDSVCTAFPYAYGSQRRGHPHLGRALGVHNLNESAGGFAGLATLLWLAPAAWTSRRRQRVAGFLAALVGAGALGAFGLPPVDNLLRALPVLDVTDNRRLSLWIAFGLVALGGIGLDRLSEVRASRGQVAAWTLAAILLVGVALAIGRFEPGLRARALDHYARASAGTPGADPTVYRARAEHQVRQTLAFYPRYLGLAAGHLLVLAVLAGLLRGGRLAGSKARPALLGLTLLDLFGFGLGLNPAIAAGDDRPETPLIAYLRREVGTGGRVLGLGEELPPNTLMRYGLADVRNYDSVELSRSLDWLAPLYAKGDEARTSRRPTNWSGASRAEGRLRLASVEAIVGASPPPPGRFGRVDRVGAVWVARLDGRPWAEAASRRARVEVVARGPGHATLEIESLQCEQILIRETFDPGWRAEIDARAAALTPALGTFLAVAVPAGRHRVALRYDPPEVRLAATTSAAAAVALVFALTGFRPFRSTRIIVRGLGRTRAAEIKSVLYSSPDNSRGMRR